MFLLKNQLSQKSLKRLHFFYALVTGILSLFLIIKMQKNLAESLGNIDGIDERGMNVIKGISYFFSFLFSLISPIFSVFMLSTLLWVLILIFFGKQDFKAIFKNLSLAYSIALFFGVFKSLFVFFFVEKITNALNQYLLVFGIFDLSLLLFGTVGYYFYICEQVISRRKKRNRWIYFPFINDRNPILDTLNSPKMKRIQRS